MKHCPPAQVKTNNLHQNGDRSSVYTFHTLSPGNNVQVQMTPFPLSIRINPISSHVCSFVTPGWIYLRSEGMFILWIKFDCLSPYCVSLQICHFIYLLLYFLIWLWEALHHSFLVISWYFNILNIYVGTSYRLSWDIFALVLFCMIPDTFMIPLLDVRFSLCFCLFFIYPCNDFVVILHCGFWINLINNIWCTYVMEYL